MWAGVSLPAEPADEERLQCGGQSGHRETSLAAWVRWLVRANSSGMAVKYQLFRRRNNWYYSDSRVIPMSAPSRA